MYLGKKKKKIAHITKKWDLSNTENYFFFYWAHICTHTFLKHSQKCQSLMKTKINLDVVQLKLFFFQIFIP